MYVSIFLQKDFACMQRCVDATIRKSGESNLIIWKIPLYSASEN